MNKSFAIMCNDAFCQLAIRDVDQSNEVDFQKPSNLIEIPEEIRLKWVEATINSLSRKEDEPPTNDIRDLKIVLNPDGTIENLGVCPSKLVDIEAEKTQIRQYPARFRLPEQVEDRLPSSQEKIGRKELFAMGGLAYHLISGKELFGHFGNDKGAEFAIETRLAAGEFPNDIWSLPAAVRILGCWCPTFGKELVEARLESEKVAAEKAKKDSMKKGAILGAKILGGVAGTALAIPLLLPVIGFGAGGVIAGSAAAGWQAGIGAVQAGSLFAFLTSAGAGGAAATGAIMATGAVGASIFTVATGAGYFDAMRNEKEVRDLKEQFLAAWKRDTDKDEGGEGAAKL